MLECDERDFVGQIRFLVKTIPNDRCKNECDADYLPISTNSRLTRGVDFPTYMAEEVKYLRL